MKSDLIARCRRGTCDICHVINQRLFQPPDYFVTRMPWLCSRCIEVYNNSPSKYLYYLGHDTIAMRRSKWEAWMREIGARM